MPGFTRLSCFWLVGHDQGPAGRRSLRQWRSQQRAQRRHFAPRPALHQRFPQHELQAARAAPLPPHKLPRA
eukprot:2766505-Lingulodinium_polyedra.AAC.1